ISAFGTCGLSLGITPALSPIGQVIIAATMFVGKLGPLMIGVTMAQGSEQDLYRYAQERVTIG
ncbi:MAG: Trk family potassium uptake protein, partial [Chloroflexi bacterium]|nr:Trk family potassium uptake protein [Chloroflexota bacterium]